jgi:hypothetical protein
VKGLIFVGWFETTSFNITLIRAIRDRKLRVVSTIVVSGPLSDQASGGVVIVCSFGRVRSGMKLPWAVEKLTEAEVEPRKNMARKLDSHKYEMGGRGNVNEEVNIPLRKAAA